MVGITSFGGYIPRYRINRGIIYSAMGWLNPASFIPGEKAVANFDEDSVSMAVTAGLDCLGENDRGKIDGLYFATTTAPYKERECAGIIATALDLKSDIRTADFTDSVKSDATAVISAGDAIKAGSANSILVCAGDCRTGRAGGYQEEMYGDGAAAILLGNENVVASLEGCYSVSYDFVDHWRGDYSKYDSTWEDRWIRDEGYVKFIMEAIAGLQKKFDLNLKDFAKVVYPCWYDRAHRTIGKKLGLDPGQIQAHMFDSVGNTGAAYTSMILVSALEEAKPGDKILVASFGNGSDAFFLQVTDEIEKVKGKMRGIKKHLESGKELDNYNRYIAFRDMITVEAGIRGEVNAPTSFTVAYRDRREILALCGAKCKKCGTPQYPPHRICAMPECGAIDQMEDYIFAGIKGKLFTYTEDILAYTINPPAIYGIVDFEGGGRSLFDLTDCESGTVSVDMPVEMSFRRKYIDHMRGVSSYFWKATPIRCE